MILVPTSDCLQHKFGANCLNGRNLNVRTVEVQLDSAADIKLLGIKIDNCFKTTASNIGKRLGLLKRTDKFLLLKVENFVLQLTYPAKTWLRWLLFRGHEANKPHVQYVINFQKRCARVILDKKWDTPSGPLFRDLNVMPWFDRPRILLTDNIHTAGTAVVSTITSDTNSICLSSQLVFHRRRKVHKSWQISGY